MMADPLSSFLNEDEEEEEILEVDEEHHTNKVSSAQQGTNSSGLHDLNEVKPEDNSNSKEQQQREDVEELEGGMNRQDSAMSDYSDIVAKIEEEMGTGPKDLDVSVDNPEKVVKTMESYIAFSVKTKTTRSDFEDPEYNVKRRYNDFLWLRQQLEEVNPALIMPPLPEKHNLTIDRFDKEFVKFRQIALHRFMGRLASHPTTSTHRHLKAFLTLDSNELQTYKKQGSGLLSRMTKSLSAMGGSYMLKNRGKEFSSLCEYAQSFGEKMGAFERITTRVASEQNDYLLSLAGYVPAFEGWASIEDDLATNVTQMSKLMSALHEECKELVDETTLKVLLPVKEYILFSESMKNALTRRDAIQHELEVITEELVKCNEEQKQLEGATPGSGGFLSRSNSEEAIKVKLEKLTARVSELEAARNQCKTRLDERNLQLKTDLERWHISKKADMKEMLGGLASRHIHAYNQQITALEGALSELKEGMRR